MKKVQLFIVLFLPFIAIAQHQQNDDSTKYYKEQVRSLIIKTFKDLKQSTNYLQAQNNLVTYNKKFNNYISYSIYGSYHKNDLTDFNNSIKASGFNELKDISAGIGFAMGVKQKANIFDVNFFNATFPNKATKASTNQEILLNTFEILQMQYGYAFVNTKNITLYPFAGLGFRFSQISLKNKQVINPAGTNISNYVATPTQIMSSSFKVSYQLGLGIDIKLGDNKKGDKTTFLFTKVGINNAIGDENFKIDDFKYNPNIKLNTLQVALGLKLALRKTVDISKDIIRE